MKLSDIHNGSDGADGSMWIYLTGEKRGGWVDAGNEQGRSSGDVLHLIAEKLFDGNVSEAADWVNSNYKG